MQISVDELESSISVKISKEAVMSINSPESLFTSVNGKLETKVYIAGLPNRTDNVIKPVRWSNHLKKYQINAHVCVIDYEFAWKVKKKSKQLYFTCLSDQSSTRWLYPWLEPNEPGSIWGKRGHPGEEE